MPDNQRSRDREHTDTELGMLIRESYERCAACWQTIRRRNGPHTVLKPGWWWYLLSGWLLSIHRKQRRSICGIFYQEGRRVVTTKALYHRTKREPISVIAARQRWQLLGTILRVAYDKRALPAFTAMTLATDVPEQSTSEVVLSLSPQHELNPSLIHDKRPPESRGFLLHLKTDLSRFWEPKLNVGRDMCSHSLSILYFEAESFPFNLLNWTHDAQQYYQTSKLWSYDSGHY